MIESVFHAWPSAGHIFLILSSILFIVTAISLARLKSIGVLDFENRSTNKLAQTENILHSIFKLAFSTILIAGLARAMITPDYPGGIFALDWPLLFSGLINLVSALPSIGVLVLLARTLSDKQKNPGPALMAAVILLAVITSGAGQLFTAAAANSLPLFSIIENVRAYWFSAFVIGATLTIGLAAHFKLMKKLTKEQGLPLNIIFTDAGMAAIPTMAAIYIAAAVVSSN